MRQITTQFVRPNILIVLDVSGSMSLDYQGNELNVFDPITARDLNKIIWNGADSTGSVPKIGWAPGEGFSCLEPTPTPAPPTATPTVTETPRRPADADAHADRHAHADTHETNTPRTPTTAPRPSRTPTRTADRADADADAHRADADADTDAHTGRPDPTRTATIRTPHPHADESAANGDPDAHDRADADTDDAHPRRRRPRQHAHQDRDPDVRRPRLLRLPGGGAAGPGRARAGELRELVVHAGGGADVPEPHGDGEERARRLGHHHHAVAAAGDLAGRHQPELELRAHLRHRAGRAARRPDRGPAHGRGLLEAHLHLDDHLPRAAARPGASVRPLQQRGWRNRATSWTCRTRPPGPTSTTSTAPGSAAGP